MITIDLNIPLEERAFNRLYLFNLLTKSKHSTYAEAEKSNIAVAAIINKIKPYEVKLLIDFISELL